MRATQLVKRGLFVGRFQPFHFGHLQAIKAALEKVEELVIVIGSSQRSHEIDNPFTAGERTEMIYKALNEAGIDRTRYYTVSVPDCEMHTTWVSVVRTLSPKFDVVFSNEPLTRRLFKEEGYKIMGIQLYERNLYSATEIRKRMLAGKNWEKLVPKSVATYIKEIKGIERLLELTKTDKPPK
jgi:nicotinamide-nucleotide adenylyltransferase